MEVQWTLLPPCAAETGHVTCSWEKSGSYKSLILTSSYKQLKPTLFIGLSPNTHCRLSQRIPKLHPIRSGKNRQLHTKLSKCAASKSSKCETTETSQKPFTKSSAKSIKPRSFENLRWASPPAKRRTAIISGRTGGTKSKQIRRRPKKMVQLS